MTDDATAWDPPPPPDDAEPVLAIDPRVDAEHVVGVLPCPANPPPPAGWAYWNEAVTPAETAFATQMLHDPSTYPAGTFAQALLDGQLVGARVEWHTVQGATGKTGCFRGVNLMRPT